jgi:hypothetical protein
MRFDPPDTVFVKFTGEISGADVRELVAGIKSRLAGHGYFLFLADVSDAGRASADARSAGAGKLDYQVRGVAFIGASPRMRILFGLVATASNLLLKRRDNPIHFFATELQARAWLSERRRKVLAERR